MKAVKTFRNNGYTLDIYKDTEFNPRDDDMDTNISIVDGEDNELAIDACNTPNMLLNNFIAIPLYQCMDSEIPHYTLLKCDDVSKTKLVGVVWALKSIKRLFNLNRGVRMSQQDTLELSSKAFSYLSKDDDITVMHMDAIVNRMVVEVDLYNAYLKGHVYKYQLYKDYKPTGNENCPHAFLPLMYDGDGITGEDFEELIYNSLMPADRHVMTQWDGYNSRQKTHVN